MSEHHAMPMFWAEFFADTEHLSEDAAKAHVFLLGHAWLRGCRLPDDDGALARLCRVSTRKWAAIKSGVLALWKKDDDGMWTQKRMTKERDFIRRRVEANRKNGKLGGRPTSYEKHIENNENVNPVVNSGVTQKNLPTLTPTLTLKKISGSLRSPSPDQAETGLPEVGPPSDAKSKAKAAEREAIVDQFLDGWDALAAQCGFARCRAVTDARKSKILARAADLRTVFAFDDLSAGFGDVFAKIRASPLLTGQAGRGWRADLDWVVTESNFLKIMEGKYAASQKPAGYVNGHR